MGQLHTTRWACWAWVSCGSVATRQVVRRQVRLRSRILLRRPLLRRPHPHSPAAPLACLMHRPRRSANCFMGGAGAPPRRSRKNGCRCIRRRRQRGTSSWSVVGNILNATGVRSKFTSAPNTVGVLAGPWRQHRRVGVWLDRSIILNRKTRKIS